MEILSEKEMAERLDYMSPLHDEPEKRESTWCIPFEYGANKKGTRISVSLAKTIAAELRATVAEAEKRELRRALDDERARADASGKCSADLMEEVFVLKQQVAHLTRKLRARSRK